MKKSKALQIYPLGTVVRKFSGKPFKSSLKKATIKGVFSHPYRPGFLAYTFEEDDSYVDTTIVFSSED